MEEAVKSNLEFLKNFNEFKNLSPHSQRRLVIAFESCFLSGQMYELNKFTTTQNAH